MKSARPSESWQSHLSTIIPSFPSGQMATPRLSTVGAHVQRQVRVTSVLLFLISFPLLSLATRRYPVPYDEGLLLTGAMRVVAGQVPHRDFYAIYGPAYFYVPAALFRIFGQSVIIVRLLGHFVGSLTVAATYAITSSYCRRSVALGTAGVTFLWLCGLIGQIFTTVFPVALLSLVSSIILVPLFAGPVTRKRLCAAGAIAGLSALYRYDTGVALLAVQVCVIVIAGYLRPHPTSGRASIIASLWPYLLGFAILTAPPIIYFLSVSPLYPLVFDVVILQARNYQSGRQLPFPGIRLTKLEYLAVYVPIITVAVSLLALLVPSRGHENHPIHMHKPMRMEELKGLLIALSLLAFVMFFKGYVRVVVLSMFPSLLPSLILIAVLFEHRQSLPRLALVPVNYLAGFLIFAGLFSAAKAQGHHLLEGSVPGRIVKVLLPFARPASTREASWCKRANPITKGFCFITDDGRMETIDFIDSHTRPDQLLFVGLDRHDKVFVNDNLIYFGSQRLPATHWSHFDPGLQNSYPIQSDMIRELKKTSPPYIVLDSEYEVSHEPNDSSKSSGVTLLDDFIHSKYRYVRSFDEMSIWQLIPGADESNAEPTPEPTRGFGSH